MGKVLEEIFWKDGKFVNSKDNKVNTKSIGIPILVEAGALTPKEERLELIEIELSKLISKDHSYKEVNAYSTRTSKYSLHSSSIFRNNIALQFHKTVKRNLLERWKIAFYNSIK